jgi:hypothetical protein
MELVQPYSSEGKCNRRGCYGVELERTKEKRETKEELAQNSKRASFSC